LEEKRDLISFTSLVGLKFKKDFLFTKFQIKTKNIEAVKIHWKGIFFIRDTHFLFSLKIKNAPMTTQALYDEKTKLVDYHQKNF